jgi:hypothetical protein
MPTSTQQFTFTVSASSVMAGAFGNLSAGQSASFPQGAETVISTLAYAWQSMFHYDPLHGRINLLAKRANAPTEWQHRYYTISSNTWTTVGLAMFNNDGHIYGNSTIDPSTGDVYLTTQGVLRRWNYSLQAWEQLLTDIFPGSEASHKNGVVFHPNLFGSGQKGVVIQDPSRVACFRHSTGTVASVSASGTNTGANAGAGVYFAAIDKTITGYVSQFRVAPGPVFAQGPSTPIWTRGYSTATADAFGVPLQHPLNPAKLLLIERNSDVSTARRYWSSTDGDNWTFVGTHPFTTTSVFCSITDMGIWALGQSNNPATVGGAYSFIWKPPA